MKKAVLILAALLLVSSLVSAQDAGVKIGGWGRGIFTAVAIADSDPVTQTQVSFGGAPRIGINIIGSSANVGFQIDLIADGHAANIGDQAKIWIKPIDMVTIQIGSSCYDDALRGSSSYGCYNWLRPNGIWGDDAIFVRVSQQTPASWSVNATYPLGVPFTAWYAGTNFEIALDPVEGLHAYAAFSGIAGNGSLTEDVFERGQYGAGYTIPGIGQIRAQYLGSNFDFGLLNAAFKLTAVSGLTLDLGAYIATDGEQAAIYWRPLADINLFASYAVMPTLTIFATGKVVVPNEGDMGFGGGIGAEYGLEGGLAINADVRYNTDTLQGNEDGMIAGLLSIQKNFSNGLIGVGAQLSNSGFGNLTVPQESADTTFVIAVPVRLEFWF